MQEQLPSSINHGLPTLNSYEVFYKANEHKHPTYRLARTGITV